MSEDKDIKKEKKEIEKEKEVLEEKALVEVEEADDFDNEVEKKSTGPQIEELPDDIKKKLEKRKTERNEKKNKKKKKKVARKVVIGNAYVKATYNNTIITLTDQQGNVLSWGSAGVAGFKGAKKSTPYAASIITRIAVEKAREEYGLEEVSVFVSGVGTGRESAVRALNANGLFVNLIKDITPVPHNGCRPKKPRRV
jgi:small subunit ribosomal protein S11